MPDDNLVRSVKRFDGKNYQAWKFQITAVLMANEIFDVVDGTRQRPANIPQNAEATKTWVKDNAKATAIIASAMEDEQVNSVLVCTTAFEMWKKLMTLHEQKSASNVGALTQRFYAYTMHTSDSVIQHVSAIQNMARQLRDLGEPISEAAVIAKILSSLTTKFNVFKTAWDSVDPERQTIANLLERLIREDSNFDKEDDSTSALTVTRKANAKGNDKDKKKKRPKKNIECYRCQERGHYASQCDKQKKEDKGKGQSNNSCAFILDTRRKHSETGAASSRWQQQPSVEQLRQLREADKRDVWITDSGASEHVTFRRDWFEDLRPVTGESVMLGDDGICEVTGVGNVRIEKFVCGEWQSGVIENVLFVPRVARNLFSVGVCTSKGFQVNFKGDGVDLLREGATVATGIKQENGLYRMLFRRPRAEVEVNVTARDLKLWHERLGHIHKRALVELVNRRLVDGVNVKNAAEFFCEACQMGKLHKLPFKKESREKSRVPGQVIHSDVCGPIPVESLGGARFYVLFKDEATGFRYVYFIRHKSDVYESFQEFERMIANKFGRAMRTLRTDNGREYRNEKMAKYLKGRGITLETTAPYTPEQNGRAERDNRTIVEAARTMLQAKGLPTQLWAEATATAVYMLNRTGQSRNGGSRTPFEQWTGRKPDLRHARIFGSRAFAYVPKGKTTKFEARAQKLIMVGYDNESSNYRLYDPSKKVVFVSRHVVFDEEGNEEVSRVSGSEAEFELPGRDESEEEAKDPDEEVRDGAIVDGEADEVAAKNARAERNQGADVERVGRGQAEQEATASRVLRDRNTIQTPLRYALCIEHSTPTTYEEAMSSPEAGQWAEAIEEELRAHEKNKTWEIVPRTPGGKTIDSRWVFKVLRDTDGSVLKYKARLCARGFKQREGIDYSETFSPVVRYDSLRVLLAVITQEDLEAVQFDVQTAFLHGILEEDIRMEVPSGLRTGEEEKKSEKVLCAG